MGAPAANDAIETLGIVGAGVMGRGIAQVAARAGLAVRLVDARPGAAAEARAAVDGALRRLADRGKLAAADAAAAAARLVACDGIAALGGCDVVVEAIVEDLEAKRALLRELEALVGPRCILATNTSSLSVTAIAAALARPERAAGFHFFNPAPVMKVVEVVGGLCTDAAVVERLVALAARFGHTPVRAADTPGFVVNHVGRALVTEGLRLVSEGIAGVEDVDRVLRDTAGFRLGPFELLDLTGLDVSVPVMESIYRQYYDEPRFRPQPLARQLLAAGRLGRKTGRGFYAYRDGAAVVAPEPPPSPARPASVWVSRARPELGAQVAARVRDLGGRLDEAAAPAAGSLCVVTPVGEDATTLVVREGLDPARAVAVDAVFVRGGRRVVMTTPLTAPEHLDAARGLLGADGAAVTVLRDGPGLVAQRVVAAIVNVAADAAQQRIAAPADVDRAAVLGLGYPCGPLAWGDRIGPRVILEILDHVHALTRDPRYRPSPWLRRRAELGVSLLTPER